MKFEYYVIGFFCVAQFGYSNGNERSKRAFSFLTIYPGTKWCGAGNTAANNNDLGSKRAVDMCCRDHDLCGHSVGKFSVKYGIVNPTPVTWSHCDCDNAFYNCLKAANNVDSTSVGIAYFNILNNRCIYQDYPQICANIPFIGRKCFKNTATGKIWMSRPISKFYY